MLGLRVSEACNAQVTDLRYAGGTSCCEWSAKAPNVLRSRAHTAILSAREGLGFESDIASDAQPLHRRVRRMIEVGGAAVHTLRDPTRGGVALVLNELAAAAWVGVVLDEAALPVPGNVRAACEVIEPPPAAPGE